MIVGALHGNEPAGVLAAQRVLDELRRRQGQGAPFHGVLAAIVGNPAAMAANRRFVDEDLNRGWDETYLANEPRPTSESAARTRLTSALEALRDDHGDRGPVVVFDLHTTSGPTPPFSLLPLTAAVSAGSATAAQRPDAQLVAALPVPRLLGLEAVTGATLLDWLDRRGFVAISQEGGQHDEARSIDHHEAGIWVILAALRMLGDDEAEPQPEARNAATVQNDLPPRCARPWREVVEAAHARLKAATSALAGIRAVRVVHRHAITEADAFVMDPGHASFEPVRAGQPLARDRRGEVVAPIPGFLLFPLYQAQGDDGFFVTQAVDSSMLVARAAPADAR